jgi:hypothetical protein
LGVGFDAAATKLARRDVRGFSVLPLPRWLSAENVTLEAFL